jgi:20S proteasome subunit beta 1
VVRVRDRVRDPPPPHTHTHTHTHTQINYGNKDNLVGALVIAGYDSEKGGQVFGCPIGGTLSKEEWAIDGSGSTFIWGFCDAEYR